VPTSYWPKSLHPRATVADRAELLLTGGTGFLGKVVLDELLRRRAELGLERIYVLARPVAGVSPPERAGQLLAATGYGGNGTGGVEVVEGDIRNPGCGIDASVASRLAERLTHVIHCAAAIDFDLPVAAAAAINTRGTLNVATLAAACRGLRSLAHVSTAYVTPHPGDRVAIDERLVDLPAPAEALLARIEEDGPAARRVVSQSGHPNSYTLTKCLAEHLLVQRAEGLPLSIIRPSIISASLQRPQPGWDDGAAAFSALVTLVATGRLRVMSGKPEVRLDVVPADVVASAIVDETFAARNGAGARIRHAVAGLAQACSIEATRKAILEWLADQGAEPPRLRHVGLTGPRLWVADLLYQRGPLSLARFWYALTGRKAESGRAARLAARLAEINRTFAYFTHQEFDFRSAQPVLPPSFDPQEYLRHVCGALLRRVATAERA
jgi:fatty acyl-CoA reductase